MNIVLLEDDPDAREALAALLSLESFTVRQAHDRASFGDATADLRSQAVIFDLLLQHDTSGLALAMEYQARRQAAGLVPAKLIALSGSSQTLPFPVDHRLSKPASHHEILAALRR
jgi:DNA-binding response OmpR family regulator